MRNLCKFVGITYGEFQSWYNYGELRICSSRLVDLETTQDGTPNPESPHVSILLEGIHQLKLEEEAGILIIQLKPVDIEIDNFEPSHIHPHIIYLPIEFIQLVIPLTDRASKILEPRMGSFRVIISPPYFDKQVREKWFRLELRKAIRGGDVLVKALFRDGLKIIDETLRKAVEYGIRELEYKDCSMEDLVDENIIWIAEAFKYVRREPSKLGDLNCIEDAGVVLLKTVGEKNSQLLAPLRKIAQEAYQEKDKIGSIFDFFNQAQWNQSISKMEESNLLGKTSAGFTSLVLFLRWKQQFHNMNQEVDFNQLYEDAAKFAVSINFEQTVSAVWIFGCFVGYENVTPIIYATPEMSSFSSLTEPRFKEKISKPEKEKADDKSVDSPEKAKEEAVVSKDSGPKVEEEKKAAVKDKKESTKIEATEEVKEEESLQESTETEAKGQEEKTTSKSETTEETEAPVPENVSEATAKKVTDLDQDEVVKESSKTEAKVKNEKKVTKSKTTGESEEGVTDESATSDKKSNVAAEEKEKAELKTEEDQTSSESKSDETNQKTGSEKKKNKAESKSDDLKNINKMNAQQVLFLLKDNEKDSNSGKKK